MSARLAWTDDAAAPTPGGHTAIRVSACASDPFSLATLRCALNDPMSAGLLAVTTDAARTPAGKMTG